MSLTAICQHKQDDKKFRQLLHEDSLMVHRVDSLRNMVLKRSSTIEKFQAKLGSLQKSKAKGAVVKIAPLKRKLKIEQQQFDLDLVRLDSCTGILNDLNAKLSGMNKKPRKP